MIIKTTLMMVALASLSLADPAALLDNAQKSLEQARKMEAKSFYLAAAKCYEEANAFLAGAQKEEAEYKTAEVSRLLLESEASATRTKNLGQSAPPPVVIIKKGENDHSVPPAASKAMSSLDESIELISSPDTHLRSRGEAPVRMVAASSSPSSSVDMDAPTLRTRFTPTAGAVPIAQAPARAQASAPVRAAAPAPVAVRQVAAGPIYMKPTPAAQPVAPRPAPAPMPIDPPTNSRSRFGR